MNIYRLRVELTQAPYDEGEGIWRVIEMRGHQTLDQLHRTIFKAFNRWEEHLYSFFMSKNRRDASKEYASPFFFEDEEDGADLPRDAASARLESLDLRVGRSFDYVFDYGDGWEHRIEVVRITDEKPTGRYPRILEGHGVSPPQYPERSESYGDETDEPEDDDATRGRVLPFPEARALE